MFRPKLPANRIDDSHDVIVDKAATKKARKPKSSNNLKCVIRTAIEELSNTARIDNKRGSKGNSRSRKPDKHKISYNGHHL